MQPTRRNIHNAPRTSVKGGFPVHYHYTVGISGEKFFYGLKDQKFISNTCDACNFTYFPPKMFCEDCFNELGDQSYNELKQEGTIVGVTKVFFDFRGHKLAEPYYMGLIKVDGSNTTFFHKIVDIENPEIDQKVKAKWNEDRVGSIFDLEGYTSS
ncbi:MAG: Zn-ribbon domain-containing OB-fold protein [Candidatus Heimdallarchaeota archaeon]|nr:Zn-ribbon domain-containing OB-fold protein [Candidatus Heimdallarchaeota archaeon]